MKKIKVIISAGGTGGHIFPALAVANKLRDMHENIEIKFVGAEGKMEMQKVPAAGYPITGLPVMGFPRKPSFKMFTFFNKLWKAMRRAKRIIRDFEPDVAAGFGGFASGPVLRAAGKRKVPYVLQEQNSYAGITNKLLAKKASKICVAYDNMDKFFPKEKIIFTGNPIRASLFEEVHCGENSSNEFGFDLNKKVVFITGGSLGARSLNEAVFHNLNYFKENDILLLWQCGSLYFKEFTNRLGFQKNEYIHLTKFIDNMNEAYACADVVVARAGAGTISELSAIGKPSILVPSPNVAEDHQTHNARALSERGAAILLPDNESKEKLIDALERVLKDAAFQQKMIDQMKQFAKTDADEVIAKEILKLAGVNV
jgi:UDP-N-acetylglucosamine--N-acetylmuramyl-(pentapeptide) pyrophosphoryl-undecaprenol N-acetylglucosamine transferase